MAGDLLPVGNVTCNVTASAHPPLIHLGVGTSHHITNASITGCMMFVVVFTMIYEIGSAKVRAFPAHWRECAARVDACVRACVRVLVALAKDLTPVFTGQAFFHEGNQQELQEDLREAH